jgi:uncharacterized protein YecE (DUF72 family)
MSVWIVESTNYVRLLRRPASYSKNYQEAGLLAMTATVIAWPGHHKN